MNRKTVSVAAAAATLVAAVASAHHNSAPLFDFSKVISIAGTVTEFQFIHPHARIRLTVVGEDGTVTEWLGEGANSAALRHAGWRGDEIKPGDKITVTGAPSRDGSARVEWREVTLPDGRVLGGGNNFRKERDELFERLEQQRREASPGE